MAGLTQAFGIANAALQADQEALNTTANNVGNLNTPGYTREVALFQESDPVTINGLGLGNGASVVSINSQRDRVLEQRIQQQQQALSGSASRLNALNNVAAIFAPTSSTGANSGGIGDAINAFFTSVSNLEAHPDDTTVRQSVLTAARNFTSSMNAVSSQLDREVGALNSSVASDVNAVNNLTKSIAALNREIQTSSPNSDAGVLEDQRQQAILKLSQYIDVVPISTENNGLTLTTSGGTLLVSEGAAQSLTTSNVGGVTHVLAGGTDVTSTIQSGSIGGALGVQKSDIPAIKSALDNLAYSLGNAVNTVLVSGTDANGTAGTPLFLLPGSAAGAAASIAVAITDPARIAAAASGTGPGDNQNALALAQLASATIIGGVTATDAYSSLAGGLGDNVRAAQVQNASVDASLQQLTTQRNSLSGVSSDEEASQLQTFERSFQVASKLFSVLDTVMGTALNLGVSGVAMQ
jgi:flagellar hook-associated protein 1 FlgK